MSGVCPVDGLPLYAASGNSKIAYCKKCQGCWVNGEALRGMVAGSHADAAERTRLFEARVALSKAGERTCPDHPQAMSRFVYRAIDLDVCPRCKGVWFDAGELKRLMAPTRGRAAAVAAGAAGVATAGMAVAAEKKPAKEEESGVGDVVVDGVLDIAAVAISGIFDLF